ncbi:hypothetical protein L7F22_008846 [Adiantum nelumboides]|nr:hypothetical protein [Adiantum nelumboides]
MAPPFGPYEADADYELYPATPTSPSSQASVVEKPLLSRSDFPHSFIFGAATSAYQVEGAIHEGGKGTSIWDTFTHLPNKILDGKNGDVATDQYHRYEEDATLMQQLGFDSYRFSISWPRIFPDGRKASYNKEGVAYYNRLIDALLRKGIKPFVTLYHWDLPQALQDSIGGWLNPEVVEHFSDFAETCFNEFGDRVKHWITLNEPLRFAFFGHGIGIHAPGRTSNRLRSTVGHSPTEPYLVGHHALLAHAAAVHMYNKTFKANQGGTIGIAVDSEWGEPLSTSKADIEAAQRHLEYHIGWFLDPIFFGDYPASMRETAGERLPTFTPEEQALLKNSLDFVGINHYTTRYVTPADPDTKPTFGGWFDDIKTKRLAEVNGKPIGDKGASQWMYIVPWGFRKLVNWVTERYGRPPIYITENGMDDENCPLKSLEDFLHDSKRVHYYQDYLAYLAESIREGADVRGYFAWSLMDNLEWESGFSKRFGLIFVDYSTLKRYPKDSALWFHSFLKQTTAPPSLIQSHIYDFMINHAQLKLAGPQDMDHIKVIN